MVKNLKISIIILLVAFLTKDVSAQVIRKNWSEMTTHERSVYVTALRALYNQSPSKIQTYVNTHTNSTYVRHYNVDFLPWHRMFIYYFEKELISSGVQGAANIAVPYWRWDIAADWAPTSLLFSSGSSRNGLFGYAIPEASLTRGFGAGATQPTSGEINGLSSYTEFGTAASPGDKTKFWPHLERDYHDPYHLYIGGAMSSPSTSPQDPIFYLHHCYVDKIWQDWHIRNGSSSIENQSVLINTVPGQPQIARSGTLDSRSLKVWYASDGLVTLDQYTVTDTENYRYTGIFVVSNGASKAFTVPSGTTCKIVAGGASITLKPGFSALTGSEFSAKIDLVSNPSSTFNTGKQAPGVETIEAEISNSEIFTERNFQIFPNPSAEGIFTITLLTRPEINYEYTVYDMMGKVMVVQKQSTDKQFDLDLSERPSGMYLVHLKLKDGKSYLKKIISK